MVAAVTEVAVAVKMAEVAPAATVTETGILRKALLSDKATVTPPDGAAAVRVTVHVAAAPPAKLAGVQDRAESAVAGRMLPL